MTSRTAIIGLIACAVATYVVTALSETVGCYMSYWNNPLTAFRSNGELWAECSRHLTWPLSFFL